MRKGRRDGSMASQWPAKALLTNRHQLLVEVQREGGVLLDGRNIQRAAEGHHHEQRNQAGDLPGHG
jgi:hypothetical protein